MGVMGLQAGLWDQDETVRGERWPKVEPYIDHIIGCANQGSMIVVVECCVPEHNTLPL